jgi:hypothetical protein
MTLTQLPPITTCGRNTVLLEAQISITLHWSLFVRYIHTEHNKSCRALKKFSPTHKTRLHPYETTAKVTAILLSDKQ